MTFVEATRLRAGQSVYWDDPDAGIKRILTIRAIRFDCGSPQNGGRYTVYIQAVEDLEDGEIACLAGMLTLMKRTTLQQYINTQHFFGDGVDYARVEQTVKRKLEQYGWTNVCWMNGETDGFGPLSRFIQAINPDGVPEEAWYG